MTIIQNLTQSNQWIGLGCTSYNTIRYENLSRHHGARRR